MHYCGKGGLHNMKKRPFKDFLFCGGISRQEYKQIMPMIRDENLKIWRVLSIVLSVSFLTLLVLTFAIPDFFNVEINSVGEVAGKYSIVYTVLSIFSVLLTFVLWVVARKYPRVTMFSIIVANIGILATYACAATTLGRNTLSLTIAYCAILFASSLLTISNLFCNFMIVTMTQLLFTIVACVVVNKPEYRDIFIDDLFYSYLFGALDVIIGGYIMSNKIKNLNLRYYVEQQRDIDALTGAKSKIAYDRRVQDYVKRFIQKEDIPPFAVVVFDVNGLKLTNDTYGHELGDELLIRTVEIIGDFFPNSEIFRTGGDEFVTILTEKDYENRNEIIKNFRLRIADVHKESKSLLDDIPIACGMATYDPANDFDYISIFSRADTIMYDDKRRIKAINKYLKSYQRD